MTDHLQLFNSRNHYPNNQTIKIGEISDQNQEMYIKEPKTPGHKTLITEKHQSCDLAKFITNPSRYDKLMTMLSQEESWEPCTPLADESDQSHVMASPDRLTLNKSMSLNSRSETPPDDVGLFPDPPSPVTDSFGVGLLELYIQEEGKERIRSSVFNSINNSSTQEVENAVFSIKAWFVVFSTVVCLVVIVGIVALLVLELWLYKCISSRCSISSRWSFHQYCYQVYCVFSVDMLF